MGMYRLDHKFARHFGFTRIFLSIATTLSCILLTSCATAAGTNPVLKMESLGKGIYVHHGEHLDISEGYQGDICNISFIVGEKGVAVIDTGGNLQVGQQLRTAIRTVTPLPILYVINTHVHPDHIFGNAAFVQDKAQFVGHEKLANAMELRRENYDRINQKYMGDAAKGAALIKPDIQVKDQIKLDLGGRSLTVQAFPPAHTNTDITVLDSHTGSLWTGDLLFIERTPVVEGDIKGLIAAIDALKTMEAKQAIPGHGPVSQDWISALNDEQRYLNTLLADIRQAIKKGESMEMTMDKAAAAEQKNWQLFSITNRRNINTVYPALEWE
jgi:quinoprotein relay system zinc metallohydrolase 2